jgi:hypothetical protein
MGPGPTFHRSKGWLVLAAPLASAGALLACGDGSKVTVRTVTAYVPAACAIDGGAYAEYTALGDYPAPGAPAAGHLLGDVGADLPEVDPAAQELDIVADQADRTWTGRGAVAAAGDVDVLLWPAQASCALTQPAPPQMGTRTGSTLASVGPQPGGRALLVGGTANSTPSQTYVAHLDTGSVAVAKPDLRTPRTRGASVTPFGAGALVAGGVGQDNAVLETAEVFDPALDGFDQQTPILLSAARSDHGAAVLATGETLLVGGVGADRKTPLTSMEIVDPVTLTVRAEGVASLAAARRGATVLRLASGQILVAGGYDASGPVTRLEWFAPDASAPVRCSADLVAGAARSFVALEGGGALAVIAAPAGAPAGFENVWVVDADCAVESGVSIEGTLSDPVLFGGAGGAPVLWTGDRWLRWSPWSRSFGALAVLDAAPAHVGDAWNSPDPGLALWLDPTTSTLKGLRFDARGPYAALPASLLVDDTTEMAPDRLAAAGVVSFDPSLNALVLGPAASAFVTDRTYGDVAMDVDAPTGEPATVVLRDALGAELEVGGFACPGVAAPGVKTAHVERQGASVTWSVDGGASHACATGVAAGARLSVGLRGVASAPRSVARDLRVVRLGTPQ